MNTIITINLFEEPPALEMHDRFAAFFSTQAGYLSTILSSSIAKKAKFHRGSASEWELVDYFVKAIHNPEVQKNAENSLKDIRNYSGLYQVIRG